MCVKGCLVSFPVKMRWVKSLLSGKSLDFLPPRCWLYNASWHSLLNFWISPLWVFLLPRWCYSDGPWSPAWSVSFTLNYHLKLLLINIRSFIAFSQCYQVLQLTCKFETLIISPLACKFEILIVSLQHMVLLTAFTQKHWREVNVSKWKYVFVNVGLELLKETMHVIVCLVKQGVK